MKYRDLRDFLAQLESTGQLRKVADPVSPRLEMTAIGDQLLCVFVDNGLLRKHEAQDVVALFRDRMALDVRAVDAAARFLKNLAGVEDPEKKRRIIGVTFIEVFEDEARKLPDAVFLAQGTLYPDVIESVSVRGPSATIARSSRAASAGNAASTSL